MTKKLWNELSMVERADVMKAAVDVGMTSLKNIKAMYNVYAKGGYADNDDPPVKKPVTYNWGSQVEDNHTENPSWVTFNTSTGEYELPEVVVKRERPATYIGGTTEYAREKFWQQDPEFSHAIDSVANRYKISSAVLKNRLNHEGFVDETIRRINGKSEFPGERGKGLFESGYYDGFGHFGTDDAAGFIDSGRVKLINERWDNEVADNEQGRAVNYANGFTVGDNVGIMAATLSQFKKEAKKLHPEFTDYQAEVYANMMYNRGAAGAKRYFGKNGFGSYKFAEGGNLSGNDKSIKLSHNGELMYNNQRSDYVYDTDKDGRVRLPWFDEIFPNRQPDDIYEDANLKNEYKGKGVTYRDVYRNYIRELQDYNDKQPQTHYDGFEKIPIVLLPDPHGGLNTLMYPGAQANHLRATELQNLDSHGTRWWYDNYRESPEYKVQNTRYRELLTEKGLPLSNYGDKRILSDEDFNRYATDIDKPIKNTYGEKWEPMPHKKGEGSYQHKDSVIIDPYMDHNIPYYSFPSVLIHEINHTRFPDESVQGIQVPDDDLDILKKYFSGKNGTEAGARFSQILNYNGINSLDSIRNMDDNDFETAFRFYLSGVGRSNDGQIQDKISGTDNNMEDFYDVINEVNGWQEFLNWAKGDKNHINTY